MASLSAKDRASLCSFTFSDGRRCRTPRVAKHPRFCLYHAQKEARARTAQKLGKDLAYFFSGDYLSACDLSTALACLIPAVVRGDVKAKTAHTVAYLVQTLMHAIHISQHEYINAFGTDGWRKSVRNSVNGNYDYRFPPAPEPAPEPEHTDSPQSQPPAAVRPGPYTDPLGTSDAVCSASTPQPLATPDPSAKAAPPQSAEMPASCHSRAVAQAFRPEEPAFSSSLGPSPTPAPAPYSTPATESVRLVAPAAQSDNPRRTGQSTPQPASTRGTHALHFDHNCRLLIDGKPF